MQYIAIVFEFSQLITTILALVSSKNRIDLFDNYSPMYFD